MKPDTNHIRKTLSITLLRIESSKIRMMNLVFMVILSSFMSLHLSAQAIKSLDKTDGLRLFVAEENMTPALRIIIPGHPESDRSIEIIFPEHVTAIQHDSKDVKHLYIYRPDSPREHSAWRQVKESFEYERDLPGAIHMLARATLEEDGVRLHYELSNQSDTMYDMIYVVTCPRLTNLFHDLRMQRTYVHYKDGFELLASEVPTRLDIPLGQWLPCRCLASYTWPVPSHRVEHREDGVTYYYSSRAVDKPLIATLSSNYEWVVASFSRETGNVWSNPELTCQHVDPQISLPPRQKVVLEIKILVIRGALNDVLKKVEDQRNSLKKRINPSPVTNKSL